MKTFDSAVRPLVSPIAILAIMMFAAGFGGRSMAAPASKALVLANAEKHVQIKVEIHGEIEHHTMESVEHLVVGWLEAAHFVVSETESADSLHLHVSVDVSPNHHFKVHSDCGGWHEDKEAAVVDAIDEILHHMIADFIEKYAH
jgi:hypothetical protein